MLSDDISLISGINITCFGKAIAATTKEKIIVLPTKRFFASAYPANAAVPQVNTSDATDINTVLISHLIAAGALGPVAIIIDVPPLNQRVKGIPISKSGAESLLKSL